MGLCALKHISANLRLTSGEVKSIAISALAIPIREIRGTMYPVSLCLQT